MQNKEVVARVSELAKGICQSAGLTLWDVLFEKDGRDYLMTVFIDREGGVFIEDCERVSRALDAPLDDSAFDSLPPYTLCVSSPGIERRLRLPEHFEWAIGKKVDVKLYKPADGKKELCGTLISFDKGSGAVVLNEGGGGDAIIAGSEYSRVSIHFDF